MPTSPRDRHSRPQPSPKAPLARVMVIDSDARHLATLADALDASSIHAIRVRGGRAALAHRELSSVSAVVCAFEMQPVDGLELLVALKQDPATSHLPVVLVSARPAEDVARLAGRFGPSGVLTRPVDAAVMCGLIHQLLALDVPDPGP